MNSSGIERYAPLHAITVRVFDGKSSQSGFFLTQGLIVTCAHGFRDQEEGDELSVSWGDKTTSARLIKADRHNDLFLLDVPAQLAVRPVSLSTDVEVGEGLYSWGFTERCPDGESVTLEMEGWGRSPLHLKLKEGMVEPGMSGAALYSPSRKSIVGMLRRSRDIDAPSGGRAVPSHTILDLSNALGVGPDPSQVLEQDVVTVLAIFKAAYESTRPIAPIEPGLLEVKLDGWPKGWGVLQTLNDQSAHDEKRRDAVLRWYRKNPRCLRFVIGKWQDRTERIGATCVLPLRPQSFHSYAGGRIREFDLGEGDIVSAEEGSVSPWLCFQSFALSAVVTRECPGALRSAIVAHVLEMADKTREVTVVAELGTTAGAREAAHFGMRPMVCTSADGRPLFDIVLTPNEMRVAVEDQSSIGTARAV